MDIKIRQEQPADYLKTESVTREAFWNIHSPGCVEHYLVHIMRRCPAFVPELDVVAVHGSKIVGNAVCSKSVIRADDGNEYKTLCLGPISVIPEYQRKGVGKQMIEYLKAQASEMGFSAMFLYGDPAYYSRHGFVPAEELRIRTPDDMYAAALQVFELHENALSGVKGRHLEDAVFEVDKTAAAQFDKRFPTREMIAGTPSQKRFERIVSMRRKAEEL